MRSGQYEDLHKPALDVDLSTMLPLVIQHLICGKGARKCKSSDSYRSLEVFGIWSV